MTFGVDTVGVAFPIHRADSLGATVRVVNAGTEDETREFRRKLPGGGFLAWGRGHVAWVEASLPKRRGSSNVEALPVEHLGDALSELHAEALAYCDPAPALSDRVGQVSREDGARWDRAAIKRLDIVRDFDDVPIGPVLDGLSTVPRHQRVKVRRFADSAHGNSETLRVGVKSAWSCVLYDKHAETSGEAPPGRLRFEARCRGSFLQSEHVRSLVGGVPWSFDSLSRLGLGTVETLGRDRFQFVGFDREVVGADVFAQVANAADLSDRRRRALLLYVASVHFGQDVGYSRSTVWRYRKELASLGIHFGGNLPSDLGYRLCLDTGRSYLSSGGHDED